MRNNMGKGRLLIFIFSITAFLGSVFSQRAYSQFTQGNIVVVRVGNGVGTLSIAGTPVFLDEYTVTGTLVRTISLPTAASGSNKSLVLSGSATSEGALTLSPDGRYLCLAGYDAPPGTASVSTTNSLTNNRVAAIVDFFGNINTTTALNDAYSGSTIRGAVILDGTQIWTSGSSGGTRYATLGAITSTQISATVNNIRIINIFNNQLYISAASGTFYGVSAVGTGTPTTAGQITTILSGFPISSGSSPYGFSMNPAGNIIYAADDRTNTFGGIQRWTLSGGTWTLAYTLNPAVNIGCRGITVDWSGIYPIIYATGTDSKIYKVTDYGIGSPASVLATASANTAFRGIAFAPKAITLSEILLPKYIQGVNSTNSNRIPYAYLVTLNNLLPNATYRYYNTVVISTDAASAKGAGNAIFAKTSGNFIRTTSPSLSSSGNYGEFTTDGAGNYKGWFITEPTEDTRFTPGSNIYMRITLNDGNNGTSEITRLTTASSVSVINFGSAGTDGTGLRGTSEATDKNFIILYDNTAGTGRPISGTFAENDGTDNTTANSYAAFYSDDVNGISGAYGTIIPNTLPNGIRRVEQRALQNAAKSTGDIINSETSSDGIWGGVNTANPSGGTTPLVIINGTLPVSLSSFNSAVSSRSVKLNWVTESEVNNAGFYVERKSSEQGTVNGEQWQSLGYVKGAGNSNTATSYTFEDRNLNTGKYKYRLRQVDVNGNYEYYELNGEVEIGVPKKFDVSQNYPNPFNPVTKINFDLPENGRVNIRLYDMLGREVAVIVNEVRNAGYHTVQFDASKLSSGIYFYKMNSGKFSGIKKMAVIK